MSDWKVHDFGIQFLHEKLKSQSHRLRSWTSDLNTDPQIIAEIGGRRAFHDPDCSLAGAYRQLCFQGSARNTLAGAGRAGARAMLAPVSMASVKDSFDGLTMTLLYRGHGLVVRFTGLSNAETDPVPSR